MSTLLSLPLELFLCILSYVSLKDRFKLRIVCKSWNQLLIHPVLLQHLDFSWFTKKELWHGLHKCLTHATHVFSLNLSRTRCSDVRIVYAEGKLTTLRRLCVAESEISAATVKLILEGTSCLQELDMTYTMITDDVCEAISNFSSHSLKVLHLPYHLVYPVWSQSRILLMLDSLKKLVTLGVTGDMVSVQSIGGMLNRTKLKKLSKLRLTEVKKTYLINVARTIHSHRISVELCVCRCPDLKESTTELMKSLNVSLCSKCKFDVSTFSWI